MTRPDIDAIEARAAKASETHWAASLRADGTARVYSPSMGMCRVILPIAETTTRDAEFIAAARADVPALCAYVRELEEQLARKEQRLRLWVTAWDLMQGTNLTPAKEPSE